MIENKKRSTGRKSDDDLYYVSGESASETEYAESTTSEDEDKIGLVDISSND